ncbi:MAG: methyltransferase [Bacteroidia bacterium]|nr:methyltransferase [Bacteroidota bacterium]MBP6412539.1 methyltransferase [Bacteroidia bacterium]
MPQQHFEFKQFKINQDKCAMKVGTDAVLLGSWVNAQESKSILDIGTGTGIIALMLAQKSGAQIDAIDIDENAFIQASENVSLCKWHERIKVYHQSLQQFEASAGDKKYDLIVSNPPYFIDSSKANAESRTAARHTDLLPFDELLNGVINLLEKKGKFCVILPFKEAELFRDMAEAKRLHIDKILRVKTRTDKTEKRLLMQFKFNPTSFSESSIVIEVDERHSYSDEYKELTKDYYLAF